jgi:hypothetical protein
MRAPRARLRPGPGPLARLATAALLAALGAPLATASAQRTTSIRDRAAAGAEAPVHARGVIDGIVTDSLLSPLAGADVTVVGTGARVTTSESGRFRFLQVPAGQYLLVVRRIGYAPTSGIVEVTADDTLRLSYTLLRSTVLLDTVRVREQRVSMRMLEFEQRRRQGQGQFLTQEEIERRGSLAATDFLRNFRGVEVSRITTQAFAGSLALSRREGGGFTRDQQQAYCVMQVLLDGIVLPQNFDLDLLPPPKQIAGIEVYTGPATIPPQFSGADRRCGVIAVWTRDGY